jgi:hypothetical protein
MKHLGNAASFKEFTSDRRLQFSIQESKSIHPTAYIATGFPQAVSQQSEKFLFQQSRKFLLKTGKLAG